VTRLLLDQGIPRSAAERLRLLGWDALHVGECGLASALDQQILDTACREQRHVITLDADFHSLLALSGATGPSVIRLRIEGMKASEIVDLMQRLWPRIQHSMCTGAMVTVTATSCRIKLLPIWR